MADLSKIRASFDLALKQFVAGKTSLSDFQKSLRKLEEAGRKTYGVNLDFVDIDHLIERRTRTFSARIAASSVDAMSKTTWRAIKKEAGIKSSGFLRKADANVGGHIDKYGRLHAQWVGSAVKTAGGDAVILQNTLKAGEALRKALTDFIAAKEFKTDLAKELQTKCQQFIGDLDAEIARMTRLQGEAHDPTALLKQLNALGMAQFKV